MTRTSLFRRFTGTNAYGTGSVNIRKTRHKMSMIYGYFYSVDLSVTERLGTYQIMPGVNLKSGVLDWRIVSA